MDSACRCVACLVALMACAPSARSDEPPAKTPESVLPSVQTAPENAATGEPFRPLLSAERIVALRGGGYFPVMIKLRDGTLVAVIRGGATHVGRAGRLDVIRSEDGGKTWSKPVVAIDSDWDDRNPALGEMPDGSLVLAYAEAQCYNPDGSFDSSIKVGPYLPFLVTSNDGGRTWSPKRPFWSPWPNPSPYGKIVLCKDGTAVMSIYQMPTGIVGILRSKDNGRTWGDYSEIRRGPGSDETQVLELPDGRLMAFSRMDNADGVHGLQIAESDDKGYTWVRARVLMGLSLHPYDVTPLKDGNYLLSFGNRRGPGRFGAAVTLSTDGCKTWDEARFVSLGWDSLNNDTGYPSTVQLDDGTIVTMYYAVGTAALPDTQAIVVRYTEKQLLDAMTQPATNALHVP